MEFEGIDSGCFKRTFDTDFQMLNIILNVFSSPRFIPFQCICSWCLVPFPLDLPEVTIMHGG